MSGKDSEGQTEKREKEREKKRENERERDPTRSLTLPHPVPLGGWMKIWRKEENREACAVRAAHPSERIRKREGGASNRIGACEF